MATDNQGAQRVKTPGRICFEALVLHTGASIQDKYTSWDVFDPSAKAAWEAGAQAVIAAWNRRPAPAAGGDGLPELPSYWAALVLNKHGEVVSRIEPSADGVVPGTVESFDRAWPGLAPHRIAITFTADQMRQYALDALAARAEKAPLSDKQIMRAWLDCTEPGCSATDAFVAGIRFAEQHHGIAPASDSAAEGGGENARG